MQTKTRDIFTTIRTEGLILPSDLLQRIAQGYSSIEGLNPVDYHLAQGEKLNEAISRSWNRLIALWRTFSGTVDKLPATDAATTPTRERWLLPLFQELGYGTLKPSKAIEIEGKSYPISHLLPNAPIHWVGCRIDLDRRTAGVAGASRTSPHSLVQEFLNRSPNHLWGFVANGLLLRILRDNISLTRQAYVEFDLAAMMEGEVYSDFVLLWLLCHQSRVESEKPQECWLEKWSQAAQRQGTRALDTLRSGVEQAIIALGCGFLAHKSNATLKDKLQKGTLDKQDYYRQILRIVYRLIFLFVAEDRNLLLDPNASVETKETYSRFYSAGRLRRLAAKRRTSLHGDLWRGLRLVFEKLGHQNGCSELGLKPLGSFLWSKRVVGDLEDCEIANTDLVTAIRYLSYTVDGRTLRGVDYRNLGAEELGSIYESLLELHPDLNISSGNFELKVASGHERKTTGSYYTPTSLINCLLDSALEPVLAEAVSKKDKEQAEKAILNLKICDPACGSGHFLVGAAHRLAKRLAAIRTGDDEPSPQETRKALRDVISHCIFGVDINPMSVELCKINLWMEALEPGKPLSFLDYHIKSGNSLLGTTPALLDGGIPDAVFEPIEGDEKKACSEFKKQNKDERKGQNLLFGFGKMPWERLGNLPASLAQLDTESDDNLADIERKQKNYEEIVNSTGYKFGKLLADAWCAAFVWKKTSQTHAAVTEKVFREIEKNPHSIDKWMEQEIQQLARQYQFFHWHLEFPTVFRIPAEKEHPDNKQTGWMGGFDCVLGNPPWERIKLQEKEWFAERKPDIAQAANSAARKRMIESLKESDLSLFNAFKQDVRSAEGESHLVRDTEYFPFCGRGDVNTYSIFAELKRNLISATGRVGCIVPSGIATDDTTKYFFQDLCSKRSLISLYSFENEEFLFPAVHHSTKFCLLTMSGNLNKQEAADFIFFARQIPHLNEENRHFTLNAKEIALINPNTCTCPIFRTKYDAELTKFIYLHTPPLLVEAKPENNHWGISFSRMFDMANDSHLFKSHSDLETDGWTMKGNIFQNGEDTFLPLYESKMLHYFDNRFGTHQGQTQAQANQGKLPELSEENHIDPYFFPLPRYWVHHAEVERRLAGKWEHPWLLGWRRITSTVDSRTFIASALPRAGFSHSGVLGFPTKANIKEIVALLSNLSVFMFDYSARQKIGGTNMDLFIIKQLPVIPPYQYSNNVLSFYKSSLCDWICTRVLELVYTAWDMKQFAKDCGYDGPPFRWDEERRFKIRAELDVAYFHLYLGTEEYWKKTGTKELLKYFPTPKDAVEYIMEAFPIVKRRDEQQHGCYRTKELILEMYDKMAEAIRTGKPYQTILDPPPGPPEGGLPEWKPGQPKPISWPPNVHPPKGA